MGLSLVGRAIAGKPASLPTGLLSITGVIPFTETIFLWQSMLLTLVLLVISVAIAIWSAPGPKTP